MDEALSAGKGGLETREEFIREAVEGLLTEVTYPDAPPEPALPAAPRVESPVRQAEPSEAPALVVRALASVPPWEQEELRLADLAGTALPAVPTGVDLAVGEVRPTDEPLLGLHNRDYPSLWAASRLARYTEEDLVPFEDFRRRVTAAAWFYGTQLQAVEEGTRGLRLTPLFPTNPLKQEAAEQGFQSFALGEVPRRRSEEGIKAGGPLFDWKLCQLKREDGVLLVGLTPTGRGLLEQLVGLSLELPHPEEAATVFLGHLFTHAPGERWGFEQVLSLALEGPSREELVAAIAAANGRWTEATASSVAQGYVARAREWGLLEPRLQDGTYRLTRLGEKWQGELAERPKATTSEREVR